MPAGDLPFRALPDRGAGPPRTGSPPGSAGSGPRSAPSAPHSCSPTARRLAILLGAIIAIVGLVSSFFLAPETSGMTLTDSSSAQEARPHTGSAGVSRRPRHGHRHRWRPHRPLLGLLPRRDRVAGHRSRTRPGRRRSVSRQRRRDLPRPGRAAAGARCHRAGAARPAAARTARSTSHPAEARRRAGPVPAAVRPRHDQAALHQRASVQSPRSPRASFALFDELAAAGADEDANASGFLFAFGSLDSARAALRGHRDLGAPVSGGLLHGDELAAVEPALGPTARTGLPGGRSAVGQSVAVRRPARRYRARPRRRIVEGTRWPMSEDGTRTRVQVVDRRRGRRPRSGRGRDLVARDPAAASASRSTWCPARASSSIPSEADPLPRRVIHLGDARVIVHRHRQAAARRRNDGVRRRPRTSSTRGALRRSVAAARRYLRETRLDRQAGRMGRRQGDDTRRPTRDRRPCRDTRGSCSRPATTCSGSCSARPPANWSPDSCTEPRTR